MADNRVALRSLQNSSCNAFATVSAFLLLADEGEAVCLNRGRRRRRDEGSRVGASDADCSRQGRRATQTRKKGKIFCGSSGVT